MTYQNTCRCTPSCIGCCKLAQFQNGFKLMVAVVHLACKGTDEDYVCNVLDSVDSVIVLTVF